MFGHKWAQMKNHNAAFIVAAKCGMDSHDFQRNNR